MLVGMRPSLAGGQTDRCPAGGLRPVSYSNGNSFNGGESRCPEIWVFQFMRPIQDVGSTWGRATG